MKYGKYQEKRKYKKYRELSFLLRQLPFGESRRKEIIFQLSLINELTKPGIPIPVLPWLTKGLSRGEEIAFWRAVNQILRRPVKSTEITRRDQDMRCRDCDALILGFWEEGFSWDAEFSVVCQEEDCGAVVAVKGKEHVFDPPLIDQGSPSGDGGDG